MRVVLMVVPTIAMPVSALGTVVTVPLTLVGIVCVLVPLTVMVAVVIVVVAASSARSVGIAMGRGAAVVTVYDERRDMIIVV